MYIMNCKNIKEVALLGAFTQLTTSPAWVAANSRSAHQEFDSPDTAVRKMFKVKLQFLILSYIFQLIFVP